MRNFIVAILALLVLGLSNPVFASSDDIISEHVWLLSKVSGEAFIESKGHEPMRVYKNRKLYPGQSLVTGARTRLLLTRGKERIQVGSNTSMSLPGADDLQSGRTIVYQTRGTLHLQVNKKDVKHFAVQTPYMVAAVKGTQFTVDVSEAGTDVRVHEGVVEVTNRKTANAMNVTAGETVSLDLSAFKTPTGKSASNRQGASALKSAQMVLVGRGEDHPAVIAERARQVAAENKSGFVSILAVLVNSIFLATTSFVAGAFDVTVHSVTGMVLSAAEPVMGKVQDVASVQDWMRILVAAVLFMVAVVALASYLVFRKRQAAQIIRRRVI
ncbi:FecR family protein [uncultured Cohaesibacter sp.]|uniref:FecR family protein n=1 Tax=uncultured Cohaesibacter sp. TaxID=1002546 RepID=UPI0029C91770|nr:FecR family protein [uncultured Cohaesibacter sp.]